MHGSQTGFNGRLLITEEFFVENISGMHNDDITELLFPDDIQPGLKFVDDKETIFLGYILLEPIVWMIILLGWESPTQKEICLFNNE